MLGLDAAGKTTILYKLHIGEILSTVPTIGKSSLGRTTWERLDSVQGWWEELATENRCKQVMDVHS